MQGKKGDASGKRGSHNGCQKATFERELPGRGVHHKVPEARKSEMAQKRYALKRPGFILVYSYRRPKEGGTVKPFKQMSAGWGRIVNQRREESPGDQSRERVPLVKPHLLGKHPHENGVNRGIVREGFLRKIGGGNERENGLRCLTVSSEMKASWSATQGRIFGWPSPRGKSLLVRCKTRGEVSRLIARQTIKGDGTLIPEMRLGPVLPTTVDNRIFV